MLLNLVHFDNLLEVSIRNLPVLIVSYRLLNSEN
ncbi:hypothetical protein G3A_03905 [Bacillus sp. 17376]|nr:hypothetical protein G3A_03905 [Bacillus sp. 17376]